MDAGSIWGAVIFVFVLGTIVGAVAHRWLTSRAKEVEAALAKATDSASAKINEVTKNL